MIINLAGRQISYTRRGGTGAPLLLIMGMAGHQGLWREEFLALLDNDFDLVTFDHRGIGDSTDVSGEFTIAELADDAIRTSFSVNLSPSWTAEESHWPDFYDIAMAERVPVSVVMRQAQAAFTHDTAGRLPSVAAPTLVIAGTADEMLRYANSELIASLIPDAKLHPLPDVGHLFWWERPSETAQAIRAHLLA